MERDGTQWTATWVSPVPSATAPATARGRLAARGQEMSMMRVRNKTDKEQARDVMSTRSALYILKVLSVGVVPLVLVGLTAAPGSAATAATAAAPTWFGAKLTSQSEPSNASNGQSCDEQGGIPHGSTCTWVAISAFENGSHFAAPRTGVIRHVRLVSCVKGAFRLQLARANGQTRRARIVLNGPEITYHGQSPCGGSSGQHYVVQSFKVKFVVAKGDYIAIKARSTGTLSCSGGDGFLLYAPPLRVGGPLRTSHSGASCDLLVQLSYK
jgi:hypothetical protein